VHIHELLPLGARPALERALKQPLSYAARYVVTPGPNPRAVVILGEAHMKLGPASALGRAVVERFELRGVETFQQKSVFLGGLLGVLIHAPRVLLRLASLGAMKGSTITDAKALTGGHTEELEKTASVPLALHVASAYLTALFGVFYAIPLLSLVGHVPAWLTPVALGFLIHLPLIVPAYFLRNEPWAWLVHPAIGLVGARDPLLAEGTVRMLREHAEPSAAVLVMGRAHIAGVERELVEKHGFLRAEL
jgi:hypothetical protein